MDIIDNDELTLADDLKTTIKKESDINIIADSSAFSRITSKGASSYKPPPVISFKISSLIVFIVRSLLIIICDRLSITPLLSSDSNYQTMNNFRLFCRLSDSHNCNCCFSLNTTSLKIPYYRSIKSEFQPQNPGIF